MNAQQEYQVNQAQEGIAYIRRELAELSRLSWKAKETNKPLANFDKFISALDANRKAITDCDPTDKGKLSGLLSEENLLVESIVKLSAEARAALEDEWLAFFGQRGKLSAEIDKQIEQADDRLSAALAGLVDALQMRWRAMLKHQKLAQKWQDISEALHTEESYHTNAVRLPKPFGKMNAAIWPAFIGSFFGRVVAVLPNNEETAAEDVARTVFER